jgi:hypothetical protein
VKKFIFLIGIALFARENPFVLPQSGASTQQKSSSVSAAPLQSQKSEEKERNISALNKKPPKVPQQKSLALGEKVADFGFISFYRDGNVLRLRTEDPVKRSFILDKPTKGVFDFAAKRRFSSKTISLKDGPFKRVSIGAHKNFYRVAIEVEKGCKPKINGLELMCR